MASPLDSTTFIFLYFKMKKEKRLLCHTWDSNLQYSDPESIGRVVPTVGDLLDDPLTPCVGTLRIIAFTIKLVKEVKSKYGKLIFMIFRKIY